MVRVGNCRPSFWQTIKNLAVVILGLLLLPPMYACLTKLDPALKPHNRNFFLCHSLYYARAAAAHPAFTSIGQNGLIIQSSPPVPSVRASALVGVVVVLAAVGGGGGGRCRRRRRCAAVLL